MKKVLVVCLIFFIAAGTFAQNATSTGLTDKDVKSFCKNIDKISSEMGKLGINLFDTDNISNAENEKEKANIILNKYGISGNNAFDKILTIAFGYGLESYYVSLENDPESVKDMKDIGFDPSAFFQSLISDSDFQVVKRHFPELKELFDKEQ